MLWIVKWNTLFHYYRNKRLEIDKVFVKERKKNLRGVRHTGLPNPTTIKPLKPLWVIFFLKKKKFKLRA